MDRLAWHAGIPPATTEVACDGVVHRATWRAGTVHLDDHPDVEGERALVALGAPRPGCLALVDLWEDALADGGFLGEWAEHEHADARRQARFRTRWERLRLEGVQDVLPRLTVARARRAGAVLALLPQAFQDRLAVTLVARLARAWDAVPADLAGDVARAVAVRARSAFVASLRREHAHPRPDALVPFRAVLAPPGSPPAVAGRLDQHDSHALVGLEPAWLTDVWSRGLAVVDGHLVLAVAAPAAGTAGNTGTVAAHAATDDTATDDTAASDDVASDDVASDDAATDDTGHADVVYDAAVVRWVPEAPRAGAHVPVVAPARIEHDRGRPTLVWHGAAPAGSPPGRRARGVRVHTRGAAAGGGR